MALATKDCKSVLATCQGWTIYSLCSIHLIQPQEVTKLLGRFFLGKPKLVFKDWHGKSAWLNPDFTFTLRSGTFETCLSTQSSTVDVVALVNDTTGTMMSCALSNPNVSAGLILGTGTNACYMESLDNVPKWDGDQNEPRQVIINTEWGAFGDNGSWNHLRTKYDEQVDRESINPGMQL